MTRFRLCAHSFFNVMGRFLLWVLCLYLLASLCKSVGKFSL